MLQDEISLDFLGSRVEPDLRDLVTSSGVGTWLPIQSKADLPFAFSSDSF